jgi:formylglycine-generating enzyme required for sulfatase activity
MAYPVRVFVSYASGDRTFAERLVADLQAAGAEVWWDVAGIHESDFPQKIGAVLQQCQWCMLVLTPAAIVSERVNLEVNAAILWGKQGFMQGVLAIAAAPIPAGEIPLVWDHLNRDDAVTNYPGEVAQLLRMLGLSDAVADRFPPRLASLGYRVASQDDAEIILPPLCDVPAGPCLMGSDPNKDKHAQKFEQPHQWVTLGAFQIATYPVTVAEYACFVRATGRGTPSGEDRTGPLVSWQTQLRARLDLPVVMVSRHDAVAYAQWLAEQTGEPWRLPSEAEWEKAARWDAATGTARIYPWGNKFDATRCNTSKGRKGRTTPVGSYPSGASPYGAQDMAGSVWEWTSSVYKPYPYSPTDGRERADAPGRGVLRGGSSYNLAWLARAAFRLIGDPGYANFSYGFRLALAVHGSAG